MKKIKSFLFCLVQLTWGLPQNLAGGIGYLLLRGKYKQERYHYSFITYVDKKGFGGVSLGMFIFMNGSQSEEWQYDTRIHEYGHSIQSLLLGPLYLLVIGVPSFTWCNFPPIAKKRKAQGKSYYDFYCEGWANLWGVRWTKRRFITKSHLDWMEKKGKLKWMEKIAKK